MYILFGFTLRFVIDNRAYQCIEITQIYLLVLDFQDTFIVILRY